MKTLIFNGSPRKNGGSSDAVAAICKGLEGEYRVVDAYRNQIDPCVDCRYCWTHEGCCVKDEMQEIFEYLKECDNILIVSPLYFMELTGPLLSVLSRIQVYFSARVFQKKQLLEKEKKGAVLLMAGSPRDSFDGAYRTAKICLKEMNATELLPPVGFHRTDDVPAKEQPEFEEKIQEILDFFHTQGKGKTQL